MRDDEDAVKPVIPERDREYRITLLMLMALILLPASIASYTIALIAIIKSTYSVTATDYLLPAPLTGILVALCITGYLAVHWVVMIKFYRAIERQIIGWMNFFRVYGLLVINLSVLVFTVLFDLYQLPIYMVPIMLLGINGYLVYLRYRLLTGFPLE
ncbi:hypothetical protein [Ostreibacterium oceani]|uniref:Uncharacterized protein n=1 Tax=Ostreibacterium oceani TaxID=2654998 RepID=A0A6N7ET87_9GAMM|nr:hypothetical protein [Ostreibacterium oceani]MPV86054.1 hypothetical protein [Ostreibacterium oceani]